MKRYILKSLTTGNEVDVTYNGSGHLVAVSLTGEFDHQQHIKAWNNIPLFEGDMHRMTAQHKGLSVQEVPTDLSFGVFWKAYNYKTGKAECERIWNKLTDGDKLAILLAIPKYDKWLAHKRGIDKKYPSTFINPKNRHWDDDFSIR